MAWGFVQSAGANNYGATVAATFTTANVQSGNKILVVVGSTWSTAPTSVQDAALNSWGLLASKTSTTGSVWLYGLDVPAGDVGIKPTITVTWGSGNAQSVVIQEVSGLVAGSTTAILDGTAGTLSGATAATGSPTYSSTASNEYLVCAYGSSGTSGTVTKTDATWTLDPNSQSIYSDASIEYKNSTGGAETSGFTTADTGGWSLLTVAIKAPAVAVIGGRQANVRQAVKRASLW